MRVSQFLRTPIRASDQMRLTNLTVAEQPPVGNPQPLDIPPQTLLITFATPSEPVQIAPLWEGGFHFIPDSTVGLPSSPGDIREENFDTWPLRGDLVLFNNIGLQEAFETHLKFISPVPSVVRYSRVELTKQFLFETLRQTRPIRFLYEGSPTTTQDVMGYEKFVFLFLHGKTGVWIPLDDKDPANDFAQKAMPAISLGAPGTPTTLRVSIASRMFWALDPDWFHIRPEFDAIFNESFVDPSIDSIADQLYNPAHPSHSLIPGRAIFRSAANEAFSPDHGPSVPFRAALAAPLADGAEYRRIELVRPPIPGSAVSWYPQRPYPLHQLAWASLSSSGPTRALRLPLTGRVYLPLTDGSYSFWIIPKSQNAELASTGSSVQLSQQDPMRRYIDFPVGRLNVTFRKGDNFVRGFVHIPEYDSKRTWEEYARIGDGRVVLKNSAQTRWNVEVLNWFIQPPEMKDYAPIYGMIRESAGRQGLAPEFLQTVFMGEGVGGPPKGLIWKLRGAAYRPDQIIDGYVYIGLDNIQDTLPDLIARNYLDSRFANVLTNRRTEINERGQQVRTADVIGWEPAIELIAAELHARLDEMIDYLGSQNVIVTTEEQRRFLAYLRFNTDAISARKIAGDLRDNPTPWSGDPPGHQFNPRYNSLQRVATAQWHEDAGVYR